MKQSLTLGSRRPFMADFMSVTASGGGKLKRNKRRAAEKVLKQYVVLDDGLHVEVCADGGSEFLSIYGYTWPDVGRQPPGLTAKQVASWSIWKQDDQYEHGDFDALLAELAPCL